MPPVIAVLQPVVDWVHANTNRSILRLKGPKPFHYCDKTDLPVEHARNLLVERTLQVVPDCTHLLFIDDDMVFEDDALERLLAHDRAVVGGLCHNRRHPYMPILMRRPVKGDPSSGYAFMYDYHDQTDDAGLVEVDATGAAFLLVKREVFEAIAKTGEKPFTQRGCGEDMSFCERAKERGFKVYVDVTLEVTHMGECAVNSDFARRNRDFLIWPWIDPTSTGATLELPAPPATCLRGDGVDLETRRARERYKFAGRELARRLRALAPGEVLDYGCGTGYGCPIVTREALLHGAYLLAGGYDPDVSAVAFGRARFWSMLTAYRPEALDGNPLAAITCFNVLQHMEEDPARVVNNLLRHAPIVIGSVPYLSADERCKWRMLDEHAIDLLPPAVSVTFLGQKESGMVGRLDATDLDLVFVVAR